WLIPVAVWAGVTTGLVVAWRRSRRDSPGGSLRALLPSPVPGWLTRLANRTGAVVYDDPDLALRIRLSRLMVLETAAIGMWLAIAERRRFAQAIRSLIY